MRGHVRKRGMSWSFVLDQGRDPESGRRKQRWRSGFATRREAEQALRQALGRLDVGDDPIGERLTVAELAERWISHMAAQGKPRPATRKRYADHLRQHVLPRLGGIEVRKIRPAHCQAVLDAFAEGHAPRTVANLRAACSSMFAFALRGGLVTVNPVAATTAPAAQRPDLTVPSPEQLAAIAGAEGGRWAVPILLATSTGMRRGEILALRWRHCDLDRGVVRVVESLQRVDGRLVFAEPKSPRARREIPLTARVAARLRQHKREQAEQRLASASAWRSDLDLVCADEIGGPLSPDDLTHAFLNVARSVGLNGVRLHDCGTASRRCSPVPVSARTRPRRRSVTRPSRSP
jgi:integrase